MGIIHQHMIKENMTGLEDFLAEVWKQGHGEIIPQSVLFIPLFKKLTIFYRFLYNSNHGLDNPYKTHYDIEYPWVLLLSRCSVARRLSAGSSSQGFSVFRGVSNYG